MANILNVNSYKNYLIYRERRTIFSLMIRKNLEEIWEFLNYIQETFPNSTKKFADLFTNCKDRIEKVVGSSVKVKSWSRAKSFLDILVEDDGLVKAVKEEAIEQINNSLVDKLKRLGVKDEGEKGNTIEDLKKKLIEEKRIDDIEDVILVYKCFTEEIFVGYIQGAIQELLDEKPVIKFEDLGKEILDLNDEFLSEIIDNFNGITIERDLSEAEEIINKEINETFEKVKRIVSGYRASRHDNLEKENQRLSSENQRLKEENRDLQTNGDTPAAAWERVKIHLQRVANRWRELKNSKDLEDINVLMFQEWDKGEKADKILPLIDQSLGTNTLEGYKLLDKEWGRVKIKEDGVDYNDAERDYLDVWFEFKRLLRGWEKTIAQQEVVNKNKELKKLTESMIGYPHEFKIEKKI